MQHDYPYFGVNYEYFMLSFSAAKGDENFRKWAGDMMRSIKGVLGTKVQNRPVPGSKVAGFTKLWKDYRWAQNKYLLIECQYHKTGFNMYFTYRGPQRTKSIFQAKTAWGDLSKRTLATPLERLAFKCLADRLRKFLTGRSVIEDRMVFNDGSIERLNHILQTDLIPRYQAVKDTFQHQFTDARDRSRKLIKNGDLKYYRGRDGRLRCGTVYHVRADIWMVVSNKSHWQSVFSSDLFDVTPDDLKVRRYRGPQRLDLIYAYRMKKDYGLII